MLVIKPTKPIFNIMTPNIDWNSAIIYKSVQA